MFFLHQIVMKVEETDHYQQEKKKNSIILLYGEKGVETNTKLAATAPKLHSRCVQEDDHEIEDFLIMKNMFDSRNAPITKEDVSFRHVN